MNWVGLDWVGLDWVETDTEESLRRRGEDEEDDFGPSWAVYVNMEIVAEHARIVALQRTFTQLAEPHGGACDGWGALA